MSYIILCLCKLQLHGFVLGRVECVSYTNLAPSGSSLTTCAVLTSSCPALRKAAAMASATRCPTAGSSTMATAVGPAPLMVQPYAPGGGGGGYGTGGRQGWEGQGERGAEGCHGSCISTVLLAYCSGTRLVVVGVWIRVGGEAGVRGSWWAWGGGASRLVHTGMCCCCWHARCCRCRRLGVYGEAGRLVRKVGVYGSSCCVRRLAVLAEPAA